MTGAGLLDYREAAHFLGLSEFTLRRFVSQGRIKSKVVGLKRRFFSKDELLEFIEAVPNKKSRRQPGSSPNDMHRRIQDTMPAGAATEPRPISKSGRDHVETSM